MDLHTRRELYIAALTDSSIVLPEPYTRAECYLAKANGKNVSIPEPRTREEMYLACLAGADVAPPVPLDSVRLEKFLYAACGYYIALPTPVTNEEKLWYEYISSAEEDVTVDADPSTGIAVITNGTAKPVKSLVVKSIAATQEGSGTPTPENIRPITHYSTVIVYVSPTQESAAGTAYTVDISAPSGKAYYGDLDVTTGEMTVTGIYESFTGLDIVNVDSKFDVERPYATVKRTYTTASGTTRISNSYQSISTVSTENYGFLFVSNTNLRVRIFNPNFTSLAAAQAALNEQAFELYYELANPFTVHLTPTEVTLLDGTNYIWSDVGLVRVTYAAKRGAND